MPHFRGFAGLRSGGSAIVEFEHGSGEVANEEADGQPVVRMLLHELFRDGWP